MPHEGNDLVTDVLVVHPLYPAPMERMRAAIGERIAMVRVDAERLDAPAVDELRDRADQALAFVFPFVAAARREHDHRRPPVSEHDDAHVAADPAGVPSLDFVAHARKL